MEDHIEETKISTHNMNYSKPMAQIISNNIVNTKPNTSTSTSYVYPAKKSLPIQRLTPPQMDERRAKILCFNCDDKFYEGHICKAKLFAIEMTNEKTIKMSDQEDIEIIQVNI